MLLSIEFSFICISVKLPEMCEASPPRKTLRYEIGSKSMLLEWKGNKQRTNCIFVFKTNEEKSRICAKFEKLQLLEGSFSIAISSILPVTSIDLLLNVGLSKLTKEVKTLLLPMIHISIKLSTWDNIVLRYVQS